MVLTLPVFYCALLNCEYLMHVDLDSLFVIHVWHPRFPLNGLKKYLISVSPRVSDLEGIYIYTHTHTTEAWFSTDR